MPVGSPELTMANLDAMDNEQLIAQIKKSKAEKFNLKSQMATDQLDNHGRHKAVKKDVARMYTVLNERKMNLRTEPEATVTKKDSAKKAVKKEEEA